MNIVGMPSKWDDLGLFGVAVHWIKNSELWSRPQWYIIHWLLGNHLTPVRPLQLPTTTTPTNTSFWYKFLSMPVFTFTWQQPIENTLVYRGVWLIFYVILWSALSDCSNLIRITYYVCSRFIWAHGSQPGQNSPLGWWDHIRGGANSSLNLLNL